MSPGQSDSVVCGICNELLDFYTLQERQDHYDAHLSEPGPSSPQRAQPAARSTRKAPPAKENVFWHANQDSPPPSNYTPSLIPVLKRVFTRMYEKGTSKRVVLCADGVCYVGTEWFDLAWGCGYRNFLMTCTSLIAQQKQPLYFPLLDIANGSVDKAVGPDGKKRELTGPGLRALQAWIEDAWHQGYDPEGANDKSMNWKLLGTRKYIGTSDIYVAFTACGIPCSLVDFPRPPKSSSRTSSSTSAKSKSSTASPNTPSSPDLPPTSASALVKWIVNYFDNVPQPGMQANGTAGSVGASASGAFGKLKNSGVIVTDRMPIILQHNGHSRTIVGYEVTKNNSINLLIFDPAPAKKPYSELRAAALAMHRQTRPTPSHNPSSASRSGSGQTGTKDDSGHHHSLASKTSRILKHIAHLSPRSSSAQRAHEREDRPFVSDSDEEGQNLPSHSLSKRPRTSSSAQSPGRSAATSPSRRPVKRLKGGLPASAGEVVDLVSSDDERDEKMVEEEPVRSVHVGKPKSEAERMVDALDTARVARMVRVNNTSLSKKDQYQIMFFPLSNPLTDAEKQRRKTVTSTTISPDAS